MINDPRPYDPAQDEPLISAFADGELQGEQHELVEFWVANDIRARQELDRLVRLKAFTDHLVLRPAPDESWDEFNKKVYNRTERSLGWTLFGLGAGLVGAYFVVRLALVILAATIPLIIRLGMFVAGAGLIMLFISALRQRFFTRKRDRYDDVKR